jgi:hypothetical protein
MYPKDTATPYPVAIAAIYALADGAIQAADVLVRVSADGGAYGAGAGTLAIDATSGVWSYTPTQAETNHQSLRVVIYKANCTSAGVTIQFAELLAEPITVLVSGTLKTLDGLEGQILSYLQLLARKDAAIKTDLAVELAALNANLGTGGGTYDNLTDSQEAIRDTAPLGTAMRGTDNAALAATALSNVVWTDAKAAFVDAAITSRHASGAAVASVSGSVNSVTTPVTTDTASRDASKATGFATPTNVTDARDAILTQGNSAWITGNTTTPPTVGAIASQVRTELTVELARIDATISSRSVYAGADTAGTTTLLTLTENSGGLRFTTKALETAAGGGDATQAKQDAIILELAKVPRSGKTYTWTNDDTAAAATVSITGDGT